MDGLKARNFKDTVGLLPIVVPSRPSSQRNLISPPWSLQRVYHYIRNPSQLDGCWVLYIQDLARYRESIPGIVLDTKGPCRPLNTTSMLRRFDRSLPHCFDTEKG